MALTVASVDNGIYRLDLHEQLVDRGARRYHLHSFDLDSSNFFLRPPNPEWDDDVKASRLIMREQIITQLKLRHGTANIDLIIQNSIDVGPKCVSIISYHNKFHEQARQSFTIGSYYPALVGVCSLGERILNHLILDLRDNYKDSKHYRKIHQKSSFDKWSYAIEVLRDWGVLLPTVEVPFGELGKLRNKSIHFNMETYNSLRDDALRSLALLDSILSQQFGVFGGQPWFIEDTPSAQFIKRDFIKNPFVAKYLVPRCGFVGVKYGMEQLKNGRWQHLDYKDYGDQNLTDEDFALNFRNRLLEEVVTREMIDQQSCR